MEVSSKLHPFAQVRPLAHDAVQITGGFWAPFQQMNRKSSLRSGYERLQQAGNFHNLRLAAGQVDGDYMGPLFMDSDLYKWVEAVAWELGNQPDAELERWLDETADLLAAAQQPDGYLNSYYTVVAPQQRWQNLDHGHELYCAGHLIQAAIAACRSTGKTNLLTIACRFADYIDQVFGPGKQEGYCGHPEIEMALVELFRETGEQRYLDLAKVMIDRRGQRRFVGHGWYGPEYMQDRTPLRQAREVEGHAVRQLYLVAGAADLYLQTGERDLLSALERLWQDANLRKMHLIGGYGARFDGESFGNPYELHSDHCYCETCAAIAAMMWNWRMLLITGEARFAEALERSLYNNFLSGISLDGSRYFYTNVLLSHGGVERNAWFSCACCPPNIMRQFSALGHYAASENERGIQLHQYFQAAIQSQHARLKVETAYPWEGQVRITVEESGSTPWALSLRIPQWAAGTSVRVNGERSAAVARPGSYAVVERVWQVGDQVEILFPLRPRLTAANPRADALRGSLAIERGPLVYCVEAADQSAELPLLDIQIDPAASLREIWRPGELNGVITIEAQGCVASPANWEDALYLPANEVTKSPVKPARLTAVPYYAWANRGPGAMRVWIPQKE